MRSVKYNMFGPSSASTSCWLIWGSEMVHFRHKKAEPEVGLKGPPKVRWAEKKSIHVVMQMFGH